MQLVLRKQYKIGHKQGQNLIQQSMLPEQIWVPGVGDTSQAGNSTTRWFYVIEANWTAQRSNSNSF
jgi:hypothetical protein